MSVLSILVESDLENGVILPHLSSRVKLNDSRCNSSTTKAGVITAITGHRPIPPEGGTYCQWRRGLIPQHTTRLLYQRAGARTSLFIRPPGFISSMTSLAFKFPASSTNKPQMTTPFSLPKQNENKTSKEKNTITNQ
ncbi:hypothetical protein AVEN_185308-1 [Araneus ventricosus]|uniref:Uncharacterized protein n=1 Tax=Araneus ventricosus TaxID=182803 RepID=A0A4Y2JT63_ARAVE|nr:hypothetical protein AVEN_185308-1 [Araneus ventricosus]